MQGCRLSVFVVSLLVSAAQPQTFRVLVGKSEVNAVEGDAVTLSVRPSSPVVSGFWKFRSSSIVTWTVEAPYLNVAYTKRNVVLLSNTSLLMLSVALEDSGVYRVTIDSSTGKEATASITLNVWPKPVPFTIATESIEINATAGDTVQLKVTPSEKVKNGSWQVGRKVIAQWEDGVAEINADYQRRATLFNKTCLQLKSANVSDTGEYSVTMTTDSGDTGTASIQLNVFKEPQPLSVSAELSRINAEVGAHALLSVRVSGEVKNGSWMYYSWVIFQWNNTIENITHHAYLDIALLPNASLLFKCLYSELDSVFVISLTSPTGMEATANITLNIFTPRPLGKPSEASDIQMHDAQTQRQPPSSDPRRTCQIYNSFLALLTLLLLSYILVFAVYIHRNHQKDKLETFDLLFIFCKGYRACLSLLTILTFIFVILIAVTVNKNWCVLGEQPDLNFVAD